LKGSNLINDLTPENRDNICMIKIMHEMIHRETSRLQTRGDHLSKLSISSLCMNKIISKM